MTRAPGRACPLRQRLRERLDARKPVCIRSKGITFLQNDKPNTFVTSSKGIDETPLTRRERLIDEAMAREARLPPPQFNPFGALGRLFLLRY